jgi:hypothetical protein
MKHFGQAWFSVPFACELIKASARNGASSGLDASQLRKDSSQIVQALIDNEADVQVVRFTKYHYRENTVDRMVGRAKVAELYIAMNKLDPESPSLRDSFLSMIVHKMMGASKEAPSLLPDQLIPLARLLALTHPTTQAESSQKIRKLVTEIWTSYLRDVVQACPPPPNFAMSPLGGSCSDSQEVNRFLADPTQSRYEFRAAEKKRRHMQYDVERTHGEAVTCDTLRTKRPFALVIIKRPDIPYNKKLKEWNERASQARLAISKCLQLLQQKMLDSSFFTVLPEASMRVILQDFFGPSAVLQYPVTMQALQSNNAALTPISGNASSAVPTKRKASDDVVDLTGA